MGSRKLSFTTRYVLIVGIMLFVANTVLGMVILDQSKSAMKALINKNMLDVANSAAGSLDGDTLGALTEDDVDGPVFKEIEDRLLVFQNSVDIEFIYAVKRIDKEHYVFTVDPDPVDPGAFGEEVVTTPALVQAADGTPTVDSQPAADRWGNFYSAYSPVYDSKGQIAGIVGIDFDASWYDAQVSKYSMSIAAVTSISVLLGGIVIMFITNRVRNRFRELDEGLSKLSEGVDLLMDEMASYSGFEMPKTQQDSPSPSEANDELGVLGHKIHVMQNEMSIYLDYLHAQAYTDALTGVGNSTAYHERVSELNEKIKEGAADFWVAIFDLNGLKEINDNYGHESGDRYIQRTARILEQSFTGSRVYRIGGDEFCVIAEGVERDYIDTCFAKITDGINAFNSSSENPATLAISRGVDRFIPDKDENYSNTFARADKAMYEDKREFYRASGGHDRRRPRD